MFLCEYVWRLCLAPRLAPVDRHSRRRYLLSPLGLADIICILPLGLAISPRLSAIVLMPQLLSLLKLARLTPALGLEPDRFRQNRRAILSKT